MTTSSDSELIPAELAQAQLEDLGQTAGRLKAALRRVIVGQDEVIDGVLTCILAGSHALLEGVPGLGKTLLVRTLSEAIDLPFSRIQFTPDLMPADILGTTVVLDARSGGERFEFRKGPIFSPIVLADEINRATPKTQSALLEAMQEHRVTIGGTTHELGQPYFVLATQNPLEMEGTYPLPEAQLDRFFFKLKVPFPSRTELHEILERTTGNQVDTAPVTLGGSDIVRLQRIVRQVPVAPHVKDYVVRLVRATHPDLEGDNADIRRFAATGASPRGAQALILAAKIRALLVGRVTAGIGDVKAVTLPALRHRLRLNFEGEAEGVTTDQLLTRLIAELPEVVD
jgi:MoxR-like ATPase